MLNLEEQADNAKARDLFWKPMAWLGAIRPTTANDAFDPALWETFVSTTLGLEGKMVSVWEYQCGRTGPMLCQEWIPCAGSRSGMDPVRDTSRARLFMSSESY